MTVFVDPQVAWPVQEFDRPKKRPVVVLEPLPDPDRHLEGLLKTHKTMNGSAAFVDKVVVSHGPLMPEKPMLRCDGCARTTWTGEPGRDCRIVGCDGTLGAA